MRNLSFKYTCLFFIAVLFNFVQAQKVEVGAEQTQLYMHFLQNKKIAIVANQTSVIGKTHLVDSLKKLKVKINCIFAPEHGFRGNAANGEHVLNGKDKKTGIPIYSLYGKNVKPTAAQLKNIDIVIFDIQDVGTRFYTFLSTLYLTMQACAENNKQLIVLDRPNPNGFYTDGPMLDSNFKSMVAMINVPIVHGMTLGEMAKFINGEKLLKSKDSCVLKVITCKNWHHNKKYILPIAPSPNLPSYESIILYPTLCLFEGTQMSMGRGTDKPFECFGAPWLNEGTYTFTPKNIPGKAVNPPYVNQLCRGILLTDFAQNYIENNRGLYLDWLCMLYENCPDKKVFFNDFFDKLAGTDQLRKQIIEGKTPQQIADSWKKDLEKFKLKRKKYLLYRFNEEYGLVE